MIDELVLTERIETLVPLTYMICFAIAYYGPNAEILGSVKLDLWHFKPVLDIGNYMQNLFMLFSVDFMSLIMNGIILRTICNINIFNVRIMSFRQGVKFWIFVIVMFFNHGQVLKFTRVLQLKGYKFGWIRALSDLILMMAEKKINIQNPTLNSTPWRNDMIPT